MTMIRRSLAGALAIAVLIAVVWVSNAPMTAHRSPDAALRLAWSARPERIERCRQLSEEELARLPQHMRQPIECEGITASYRLQVRVEGALVAERVVHGGGLRRDRRLFVFDELPVPAGDSTIDVRFDRVEPDQAAAVTDKEDRGEVPPHLTLTERVRFSPRQVVLVTYDSGRRVLTAVAGSPQAR